MGCNCGKSAPSTYNARHSTPTNTNGTNQILLKQIQEQQRQQQQIQQVIQQSANPAKVLIKTYR